MQFHTWERCCMCEMRHSLTWYSRTHLRECVLVVLTPDPVWLTDSQELFHLQAPPPHTLICNNIFWFIGLISLRWWSMEDVKQNLQKGFNGFYWPGCIFAVTCTCMCEFRRNTDTKRCTHATNLNFVLSMIFRDVIILYALDFLETAKHQCMI